LEVERMNGKQQVNGRNLRRRGDRGVGIGLGLILIAAAPAVAQEAPTPPMMRTERSQTRPQLQLGSQGSAVAQVQAMLTLLGYYSGPVDGQYQQSTAIAVATFQQAAGLVVDGVVGPVTWAALLPSLEPIALAPEDPDPVPSADLPPSAPPPTPADPPTPPAQDETSPSTADLPVLRLGMRGFAVERLQERLRMLGTYDGPIDGIFGPATEAAVQAVQRRHQLNPDGVVGAATWTVLFRANN
jgi:N-acetylmuramoyl-L-alanine amidase